MGAGVKKMYKEALANEMFNAEMYRADPEGYLKPHFWSDNKLKVIYTSAYYGWMVAYGLFNRKNYY